jgi:hypothetical protein
MKLRGCHHPASNSDPLHLIEAEFLAPAVVELCRARAGMVRHLRRLLQRAAVLRIRRNPGCPQTVIAELDRDASVERAGADHRIGVRLWQGRARERTPLIAADFAEQRPLGILGETCALDGGGEVGLKAVGGTAWRAACRLSPTA